MNNLGRTTSSRNKLLVSRELGKEKIHPRRRRRRKNSINKSSKDSDSPKQPLSAYNLFFQYERKVILGEAKPFLRSCQSVNIDIRPCKKGKISFVDLARTIAAKWKNVDDYERSYFDMLAAIDKERYIRELKEFKNKTNKNGLENIDSICPPMGCAELQRSTTNALVTSMDFCSMPITTLQKKIFRLAKPNLHDLAAKLDSECTEFIVSTFS